MLQFSTPRKIVHYRTENGRIPFREWMESLRDMRTKNRILTRIDRAEDGNFGDHRTVGFGVVELKIDTGPGYRVYLGMAGQELVILLCGGDKSSQRQDVPRAQDYWQDYKRRA
jgi:putative addiction module killer protein